MSETDIKLASHQPKYYQNSEFMKAINTAIENELRRLMGRAEGIIREANVTTAEEWLSVWERSVGLPNDTGLSIEMRRSRVLARLRQLDTTTAARIAVIVQAYTRCNVEVVENYDKYNIEIRLVDRIGKPEDMDKAINQVSIIIPAHLSVNYFYRYRTWGEAYKTGKTWGEFYDLGYTWRDIYEKEEL